MTKKKYIVAVSGGVDSIVLLHKLMRNKPEYVDYIVAHVDHNVRENSSEDAKFVEKMALKYNLLFRQTVLNINKKDEQSLREARYDFLYKLKDEYKAESIITAHHQDDVLESMLINIIRRSGPRGLNPMTRKGILRPLLTSTKADILHYAEQHSLQWVEDETNDDETYLRNYVRKHITPKLGSKRHEFIEIQKRMADIYNDIDMRVQHLIPKRNIISRQVVLQLPHAVAKEVMRAWLLAQGVHDITAHMLESVVIATKTLPVGKKIDVGKHYWLESRRDILQLSRKSN